MSASFRTRTTKGFTLHAIRTLVRAGRQEIPSNGPEVIR
jgi:hypothetical protein